MKNTVRCCNQDLKYQCTVCGEDRRVNLLDDQKKLFKCSHCTHAFIIGCNTNQEELYSCDSYYKAHKNWFDHPNYALFKFIFATLVKLNVTNKLKLFDIGCGRGDFLKYIKGVDPEVDLYGVDYFVNEDTAYTFIKGDFLNTDIKMKFDVITGLSVIEHVDSPCLFVDKIHNLLLSDGIVFITTINNDNIFFRSARFLKKIGICSAYNRLYGGHHLQYYSNKSLKMLFERKGFQVLLQKNHNYSIDAVDVPESSLFTKKWYMFAIWVLFFVSSIFKRGILQTIVCKKTDK